MRWVDSVLAALLDAPVLALLALSFGLGRRFGARTEVWAGAAAVAGAVAAGGLSELTDLGPIANAAVVVPAVFGAAYLLGVCLTTRPEVSGDATRLFIASALAAIAVVGLLVVWRGDDVVRTAVGGSRLDLVAGASVGVEAVIAAVVAVGAIVALAVLVTASRFRVRLLVMDRAPELLQRAGHDARQASALFGALTAGAAALAGVLGSRHSAVAPTSAVQLTVLGAEVALLGGLGSIPGAATAAVVLSLATGVGNEFRAGWGTLAAHAVVLAVLLVRQGNVGPWGESHLEVAR